MCADGKVYKAIDLDDPTRKPVAMKKVRRDARRGYSVTVMREISLLMRLKHPNIVALYEVCTYGTDGLFLVMNAMDTDLLSLYYSKVNGRRCVAEPYAKWFVRQVRVASCCRASCKRARMCGTPLAQLLTALAFCHEHNVVHRDVKSSNVRCSHARRKPQHSSLFTHSSSHTLITHTHHTHNVHARVRRRSSSTFRASCDLATSGWRAS